MKKREVYTKEGWVKRDVDPTTNRVTLNKTDQCIDCDQLATKVDLVGYKPIITRNRRRINIPILWACCDSCSQYIRMENNMLKKTQHLV